MKFKLDIILPVYHEQDNIERVLDGIKKHVKTPHTINLVFAYKKDPTIKIVEGIQKKYKNINLLISKYGKGLRNQLVTGFEATNAPYILIMMSDLSDDPKDIDKMVRKLDGGEDFVCGSRYIPKGARLGGSRVKGFVSYFGCFSLRLLTDINTHDATNAFKCFKRGLLTRIKIESKVGYELPLELIVKAHAIGMKIDEIPTVWRERDTGSSKFKLLAYIPNYLRWYFFAVKNKFL